MQKLLTIAIPTYNRAALLDKQLAWLATAIKGRNPITDGFGLVVFASLTPIIFVMAYGMFV